MLLSSKPLTISDFEQFSDRSDLRDEAIIGKSLFGRAHFKAITSLSLQRYSGETTSIVNDFKNTLSQKYGAQIASFVLPQQAETNLLQQGLTKKTIAAVLKKASLLHESHFFSYHEALKTKELFAIKVVEKLKGTSCYQEAQEKYQAIQKQVLEFEERRFELDPDKNRAETLQREFQNKLREMDTVAREMATLSIAKEKIEKIFGKSEQSRKMLKIFLQHEEVMKELKKTVREISHSPFVESASVVEREKISELDSLIQVVEKAATVLTSFSNHFSEENNPCYFSLNQRGEVIIQDQASQSAPAQRAQEHAVNIFFDALKKCYGADFVNELKSIETQNHPLMVKEAVELFQKIHESFENLAVFFKKQPLLITKEYLDILRAHPHLATEIAQNYAALAPLDRTLLRSAQENIATSKNLITAMMIGSDLVSHTVASSPTCLTVGSLHCPPVLLVLGMAALTGVAWAYMSGHREAAAEAAGVSTVYALEEVLAEMAVEAATPGSSLGVRIVPNWILGGAIGWIVKAAGAIHAIRTVCIGGSISGSLASQAEDQDHEERVNVATELSLEARLGDALEKLVEAVSHIPIDAASVEITRSRRTRINL